MTTQVFQAEPGYTYVQTTARSCAGMRAMDVGYRDKDPLAKAFAGSFGLDRGRMILNASVEEAQGQERHIYFAARGLLLDRQIEALLRDLQTDRIQVINLGCGMDTRPWRLSMPAGKHISWIDVDTQELVDLKRRLIQEEGAEAGTKQQQTSARFPLKVDSYLLLSHTISSTPSRLEDALRQTPGLDADTLKIWVMEGLLYYLDEATCDTLMKDSAALSPSGSKILASMVTQECKEKVQRAAKEGLCNPDFYFRASLEDLLGPGGSGGPNSMTQQAGWSLNFLTPDISNCLPPEDMWGCYPAYSARHMRAPYVAQLRDVEHIAMLERCK